MNTRLTLAFLGCLAVLSSGFARHHEKNPALTAMLNSYNGTNDKVLSLAEAIPEDKYDWHPAEGVRSVKQSVGHIVAANYFIGSMMGAELPEGLNPREVEQSITSKEKAIAGLRESSKFVREAMKGVPESEYDEETEVFGNTVPKFQLLVLVVNHSAEHLGQLIAYARSNDVTPPWSVKSDG